MKNQPGTLKNHVFILYLSNYSFAKYYVLSNHNNFGRGRGGRAGINKNVTDAGSQMTWEGDRAGINKNVTEAGSQLTWEGDRAGISKNVT